MEEPSSSAAPPGPPLPQPSPSMLSIYLQRTASGQLTSQPSARQELPAAQASGHGSISGDPSPRQQLQPQGPLGGTFSSPFYAQQREGFLLSSSSIPISQRSSSQPALSQSSTDPPPSGPPSGPPSRQPAAAAAFSPSRSSFGSGYSLQSGGGDEPGAAESHNPGGGAAGGGGLGPASGGVAYGPGLAGSAQRSKARKLRHIMQLEEEVQALQGISSQQQATIGGLQQEAALLTASNRQLSIQVADLQEQLHKQEAFTELVTAELRRLSVIAGEPAQLPTFSPAALQEQQQLQAQHLLPGAQLSPQLSDMALQQQLASQYGLQGFAGGFQQYPAGIAHAAQPFPTAYVPQFAMAPLGPMQPPAPQPRASLLMEGGPYYPRPPPQQQQRQSWQRVQQPRPQPRPAAAARQLPAQPGQGRQPALERSPSIVQGPPTPREQTALASHGSLERPASAPLPAAVAEAAAAAAATKPPATEGTRAAGAAAQPPPSTEAVREAAIAALALAERRSVRFSADLPRGDAAAESRRQALATAGRGNTFPLARGDAAERRSAVRTLSAPVASAGSGAPSAAAEAAGPAAAPAPVAQPDPFRVNVPASAFQIDDRHSGQETPAWRQQQAQAQHFAAVPEAEGIQNWQPSQVDWPLGPRAQQPFPAAGGPVGNVMQAFRGLSMQGSDPAALPPSGAAVQRGSLHQPFSMQPGGRYGELSWDDMMRSLSDPVFQTGQDGAPIIPPGLYPQGMEGMARGPFESYYNVEQPEPPPYHQPHQQEQQPGDENARQQ